MQDSETQNGCVHSESDKGVGEERVDSVKEELDRGHLIISPEVSGGNEAADEKEEKEGKQTDSMTTTMGTLSLS